MDIRVENWLQTNHDRLVGDLAALVKVPSISNDGEHQTQIEQTAELTCEQMRRAGLNNVAVLRTGASNPYAYGEWLGAPANRPSSSTPITTCSRSTTWARRNGSRTRGR